MSKFKKGQKVYLRNTLTSTGVILSVDEETQYATVKEDDSGDKLCYPFDLLHLLGE